jgi:hypothetical protein
MLFRIDAGNKNVFTKRPDRKALLGARADVVLYHFLLSIHDGKVIISTHVEGFTLPHTNKKIFYFLMGK